MWATPTAAAADKGIRIPEGVKTEVERGKSPDLNAQVMSLWPTPTSLAPATELWATPMSHERTFAPRKVHHGIQLANQVHAAMWATPTAAAADKGIRTPEGAKAEVERGKSPDLNAQVMSLWSTPTSLAPAANSNNEAGNSAGLVAIRKLALWPTATTPSGGQKNPEGTTLEGRRPDGSKATVTLANVAIGLIQAGSLATTEKPGALNPEFVSWLMGFPVEWLFAAPSDRALPRTKKRTGTTGLEP
jgi:hypothetical protein